ncbi:hypothetical protein ALC53_14220 [Atta colombica]|uniref:Uncharacterized protein n=1 Tax=Atta colombica TaxID=520822 RepID=A0A195AU65_9HYME|nr:hypothetical protein ALC53_14220 [Atta colombica]
MNRGEDFMEQAGAGDFFTDTNIAHPQKSKYRQFTSHLKHSRASRNPPLSANQEKMESEQSPSIGKDSCPIIETTRHRSMENGKRNPDLHAQNTESSECGPATEDTSGYVGTRTTRANVDERLEAIEAKSESQVGRRTSTRS